VFQCPMAPVLKKGRWVQKTDKLRNPFFGSAMLTCGSELK
jgi:membrane fusion protein, copper/silver efflux system